MAANRTVYLTRHGETDWNAAGRWQGHTDIPLNEHGRRQAGEVGERLRGAGIVAAVSSDLSRANETARIIAARLGIEVVYTDRDLRERSFGIFEGLTREECVERHAEAWRAWVEEQVPPPGGEAREGLAARVSQGIGTAVARVPGDGPILLVSHGGALRAAIGVATGDPPGPIANGAIWQVTWEGRIAHARPFSPVAPA